jgi:hypothetical protein
MHGSAPLAFDLLPLFGENGFEVEDFLVVGEDIIGSLLFM